MLASGGSAQRESAFFAQRARKVEMQAHRQPLGFGRRSISSVDIPDQAEISSSLISSFDRGTRALFRLAKVLPKRPKPGKTVSVKGRKPLRDSQRALALILAAQEAAAQSAQLIAALWDL